ncbi:uncharacterized protein JCM6883_001387 [Sporobolomyces salmoneus]|uniref:uncharacterized protein n=1 Tax=Sporobolomyces salmoneus TaxID=183962 RepID=UPI00317E00F3
MDGSNRDWTAATETEDLYDEAHDCLRELFEGAFLDISSLEVLYVNNICPTDGTSEIKLGKTKPATNLRELTIQGHPYGGSFWDTVLKHERDRPRLAQVKISGVSYTSVRHLAYTSLEIPDWRGYLHDSPLLPRLANSVDVMMVHECCAERLAQCSGVLFWGTSLSSVIETWVYFQGCNLRFPEAAGNLSSNLQLMLDAIGPAPRRSFYLSLPWKRSQLFGNSLSILSAMEELGVETHFKNDEKEEEENYVIARMPRSFVDFVKRQKEAETRKEVEEEQ